MKKQTDFSDLQYALASDNGTHLVLLDPYDNRNSVDQPAAVRFIRQLIAQNEADAERIAELEAESFRKSEVSARLDDRRLALRSALSRVRGTDAHEHASVAANEAIAVAIEALAADDKAADSAGNPIVTENVSGGTIRWAARKCQCGLFADCDLTACPIDSSPLNPPAHEQTK